MALRLVVCLIVSLILFSRHGESTHNGTHAKRPKNQSQKSWSLLVTRVDDFKAQLNLGQNKSATEKWEEMVQQSRARLAYLNHKSNGSVGLKTWDLPLLVQGSEGGLVVNLEMGSPAQAMTFLVDTGLYLTWMQCQPCDPRMNSPHNPYPVATQDSFVDWVKYADNMCHELGDFSTCDPDPQLGQDCTFHVEVSEGNERLGRMGIDTINYSNNRIRKSSPIHIGMAFEVRDIATGYDGILGLARSPLGLSYQLESEFHNVFSHCLVNPNSGRTSKFTMGPMYNPALLQRLAYTPMEAPTFWQNRHYYVTLLAIHVGSQDLGIDPSVFAQIRDPDGDSGVGGTVIDTGTDLTFIPEVAFNAVEDEFRDQMRMLPMAADQPLYPFCFDTSDFSSARLPKIPGLTFKFANGVDLVVTPAEAFRSLDDGDLLCLAMDSKDPELEFSVIGSIFLQNQYVVYDNQLNTIGIAPWNCQYLITVHTFIQS